MKKIIILAAAALALAACGQKGGYAIKGHVEGLEDGVVYLSSQTSEGPIDSAAVAAGNFAFACDSLKAGYYVLSCNDKKLRFFVDDEGTYTVEAADSTFNQGTVKGGTTQNLNNLVTAKQSELMSEETEKALMDEYYNAETSGERKEEIANAFDEVSQKLDEYQKELVKSNPETWFALNFLRSNLSSDMPFEELKALAEPVMNSPKFAGDANAERVTKYINQEEGLLPGNPAPVMTMATPDGGELTFSDVFKANKVTMLDFWASWCGPCRRFNPTLTAIYAEYHKLGFEVLGISLDRDGDNWKKAIEDDKLVWPHVSDLKYWQSDAAQTYNINYIPQNVFVDGEGKIIARKLSDEASIKALLDERLK